MNSDRNPINEASENRRKTSRVERRRRRKDPGKGLILAGLFAVVLILAFLVFMIIRYAPTRERMPLSEYFTLSGEESAAVIANGEYDKESDPQGIIREGEAYVSLTFIKDKVDDGYVYDTVENTLRYTTDSQVITAYLQSKDYLVDREQASNDKDVVIMQDGVVYLDLNWAKNYTDLSFYTEQDPNRIVIETAGWKHQVATIRRNGAYRRFGGVKSKILDDAAKGDQVIVLENYGKWSLVLNERGVLGCIENSKMKAIEETETAAVLPKRDYKHRSFGSKISLGWHQVTTQTANQSLSKLLQNTKGMNVISPTWYGLQDNQGGISDYSDAAYVQTCHAAGIQVWALVSNFVNSDVDTTTVLNTTSARDALVNNLIASAITANVDGINVDFESLSIDAKDGYIEFIRELSLKCRKNDLFLSVDNYKPSSYTEFYNRSEQAKYADYIILMAYDEHYNGSEEAGSNASLPFVKEGIADTLKEVPAEQLVLGMPFYTRIWITDDSGLTSSARGIEKTQEFVDQNQVEMTWQDDIAQYYGEFTEDGTKYQIWMEDTKSLSAKLMEMQKNNLAGGAFWKLGFEPSSIWDTIITYMN